MAARSKSRSTSSMTNLLIGISSLAWACTFAASNLRHDPLEESLELGVERRDGLERHAVRARFLGRIRVELQELLELYFGVHEAVCERRPPLPPRLHEDVDRKVGAHGPD